jgi:DNA-binding beta-propeller fold protein YncE
MPLKPRMEDTIQFQVGDAAGEWLGDDAIRTAVRQRALAAGTLLRLAGTELWIPIEGWATFSLHRLVPPTPMPPAADAIASELPDELASVPVEVRSMLLYWVHEGAHTFGPLTGEQLRRGLASERYGAASVSIVSRETWCLASALFTAEQRISRLTPAQSDLVADVPSLASLTMRCPTCLEVIALLAEVCPECDEPTAAPPAPPSLSQAAPAMAELADASWLKLHWRPLLMVTAMTLLVCSGIALRYLAPGRWSTPKVAASHPNNIATTCADACWSGEACQVGRCIWQASRDAHHVSADPVLAGPFSLSKEVSDALPLDGERFAAALLGGVQILSTRTGEVLELVSDAPQALKLFRVDDVIYASAPQRIYVVDALSTRLLKTIEVGSPVSALALGAANRRALVSLPNAHAVAIVATEFHAEIDRIQFGDDDVGPVGADETGKRALTTTGKVPIFGTSEMTGGAAYAFDPSRLASKQDRVRAAVAGNPVSVLMTPDGAASYVVVRAGNALVPLEWLPSGAVRERERVPTCREPEQIELLRRDRRALVRCRAGRALEVFDLNTRKLLRHLPFNAPAVDMAITPDGAQAIVALHGDSGGGAVAIVDLDTYDMKLVALGSEPSHVRLSPDGATALVLSARAKTAWVLK